MKKTLFLSLIFCYVSLFAQEETLYFPVKHHIVNNTAGTGIMQDATVIPYIMSELNRVFAPINVQFYTYCEIDTFFFKKTYFCIFNIEFNFFNISEIF